jgi:hypothetical protein
MSGLAMWVVYESPADYPGRWVARRHLIAESGSYPTKEHLVAADRETLVALLPPGLVRVDRDPADPPIIREVWL